MLARGFLTFVTLASTLMGCSGNGTPRDSAACYPDGAVEPMASGEVINPYFWDTAHDETGEVSSLDLEKVACNDDVVDWSPFDLLLFVSIPAW